jgi:small subunit ribosomal protein S1
MEDKNQSQEYVWDDESKGFGEDYSRAEREKLEKMYDETLTQITEKEVVKGIVVGISDRDVILNIGFKSDGLISATEFRDQPDLKVGDEVEVFIEKQEDTNGQLILSRRKAKIVKAWENIQFAEDNDEIIEGFVKRRTKGGLIVDIHGIEAFLPGSQIDVKPIRDFDIFVGKKMEVKVVKINYTNDNVVVSHKVLIEKDLEKQKAEILENLEKGQVLEGVIKNMTNFGVFIDLGGVDGLLHITDISWGRINHPEEVLNLDEKVNVVVLDFDDEKKRISLGMKQLTPHPWDSLSEIIEIGSKVKGKIVNVADYGAFLEIMPGVEGLIHVSEMSWSQHLRNPQDFIKIGDELEAVVLTLDREERKMSLGIKQLTEDPWTKQDVLTKYAVGTRHKGIVRNLTNFGLFIELEEGIDGLVHVSDLSWTKKIKHPSEFVKVGDELEVQVLELDVENRRLALGHKQLEENPWDTFESVFTKGSNHKCTVISKNDKGAVLELPYGIEGFATAKNLVKEDGSVADVGETLEFMVLEFSKDDKRIVLSHTATFTEREDRPSRKKKPKKSTLSRINTGGEKDTLGDLEALSELKEKMEEENKKDTKAPKKKETPKVEVKKEELEKTQMKSSEVEKVTEEISASTPVDQEAVKAKSETVKEPEEEKVAEVEDASKKEPKSKMADEKKKDEKQEADKEEPIAAVKEKVTAKKKAEKAEKKVKTSAKKEKKEEIKAEDQAESEDKK